MRADAITAAVNAMHKAEDKSSLPPSIMPLVLDGLQIGGLLVLHNGLYEISREGTLLNDLLYD